MQTLHDIDLDKAFSRWESPSNYHRGRSPWPERCHETPTENSFANSNQNEPPREVYLCALMKLEAAVKQIATEQEFTRNAARWKRETKFVSNTTLKVLNQCYQRIIGLGSEVVPMILHDLLENGPKDWYWALTAITGENPIAEESQGVTKEMREAWIQWGINNNYLSGCQQKTKNNSKLWSKLDTM